MPEGEDSGLLEHLREASKKQREREEKPFWDALVKASGVPLKENEPLRADPSVVPEPAVPFLIFP